MSANLRMGEFGESIVTNILNGGGFDAQANMNQSGSAYIFITHGKILGVQVKTITKPSTGRDRKKDGAGHYGFKLIDNPKTPIDRYTSDEVSLFAFLIFDQTNSVNHLYLIPKDEVLKGDGSMPTKKCIAIAHLDDPDYWATPFRDNFSAVEMMTGKPPRHSTDEAPELWIPRVLGAYPKQSIKEVNL